MHVNIIMSYHQISCHIMCYVILYCCIMCHIVLLHLTCSFHIFDAFTLPCFCSGLLLIISSFSFSFQPPFYLESSFNLFSFHILVIFSFHKLNILVLYHFAPTKKRDLPLSFHHVTYPLNI